MVKEGDNSFGTASVILGILSICVILLTLLAFLAPLAGLILGAIALFFALAQKKREKNKWAKWGLILAIIGIAINLLILGIILAKVVPPIREFKAQCDAYGGCDKYLEAIQTQQLAGSSDLYSQYGLPGDLENYGDYSSDYNYTDYDYSGDYGDYPTS